MSELSSSRQRALVERIELALRDVRCSGADLRMSEPKFTAAKLTPSVEAVVNPFQSSSLRVRGDGCSQQAVPATLLGANFYPDVAITYRRTDCLWAAEVKFLKGSDFSGALSKAVGQANVYLSRYRYVTLVLVADRRHGTEEIESLSGMWPKRLGYVLLSPS